MSREALKPEARPASINQEETPMDKLFLLPLGACLPRPRSGPGPVGRGGENLRLITPHLHSLQSGERMYLVFSLRNLKILTIIYTQSLQGA